MQFVNYRVILNFYTITDDSISSFSKSYSVIIGGRGDKYFRDPFLLSSYTKDEFPVFNCLSSGCLVTAPLAKPEADQLVTMPTRIFAVANTCLYRYIRNIAHAMHFNTRQSREEMTKVYS